MWALPYKSSRCARKCLLFSSGVGLCITSRRHASAFPTNNNNNEISLGLRNKFCSLAVFFLYRFIRISGVPYKSNIAGLEPRPRQKSILLCTWSRNATLHVRDNQTEMCRHRRLRSHVSQNLPPQSREERNPVQVHLVKRLVHYIWLVDMSCFLKGVIIVQSSWPLSIGLQCSTFVFSL